MSEHKDFRTGRTPEAGAEFAGPFTVPEHALDAEAILRGLEKKVRPFEPFFPTWDNIPDREPPLVEFAGVSAIRRRNVTLLVSGEGAGKSQVCEVLAAAVENPELSEEFALGFDVITPGLKALLIDTERDKTDLGAGLKRVCRRAGIERPNLPERVKIGGFFGTETVAERLEILEALVHDRRPDILMLDTLTEFVKDSNSLEEAGEFYGKLARLCVTYDLAVFGTIHRNTGQDSGTKARGHVGSEMTRKAGMILHLDYKKELGGVRHLWIQKNRSDRDTGEVWFAWNEEHKMFLATDAPEGKTLSTAAKYVQTLEAIYTKGKREYTHSELVQAIMTACQKSERTARNWIEQMTKRELLAKSTHGIYTRNQGG